MLALITLALLYCSFVVNVDFIFTYDNHFFWFSNIKETLRDILVIVGVIISLMGIFAPWVSGITKKAVGILYLFYMIITAVYLPYYGLKYTLWTLLIIFCLTMYVYIKIP